MKFRSFVVLLNSVVLLGSLWACAGTTLQNVWMDDTYTGQVSGVMVLGVTKNKAVRQMFESELSRQLESKGVRALPSFPLFPSDGVVDKKVIVDAANKQNVDSVIVAKVLNVQSFKERVTDVNTRHYGSNYRYSGRYNTYRRPGGGWYGDYTTGYSTVRSYDYEYFVSHAETALYLLNGEKMVWSALTETETDGDIAGSIREMAEVIVVQLEKDGII